MCTVTYITGKDGFYLTSNRDEKKIRPSALHPAIYNHAGNRLLYPKDTAKGGTWIALNENGNIGVLLNGAFKNHVPQSTYRKSRGIIFTELISNSNPNSQFSAIDLNQIEPFTVIFFINENLFECRWDGQSKYQQQLDKQKPMIWSSATLYEAQAIKKREQWFFDWLKEIPQPSQKDIIHFHQFTGDGDSRNSIQMNRDNHLLTLSITSISWSPKQALMKHMDLLANQESENLISFSTNYQLHDV